MSERAAPRGGVDVFDESRPMWHLFGFFLVPLMASNVLQSVSGTLNSIFLGRLIGVSALAAASAFFPILFFLISFFIGLSSGATVLIGQAFGAGDIAKMKKIAGTMLSVAVVLGVAVGVGGYIYAGALLALLATPADIIAQSTAYARVLFIAMPFIFIYFAYISFLRGLGDSKTPLWTLVLSTAIAVVVTPTLIRGWFGLPQLGVESAAFAALASNAIGLIVLLAFLRSIDHPLAPDPRAAGDLLIDFGLLGKIVRIGVPTGLQMIMVSLAEVAVLSFVNRFGSTATAAYGAVNQVASYVQFPALSIGITASIFTAQCIGARRLDRIPHVVHAAIGVNYVVGGVLIAATYLLAWPILEMFIVDPKTLAIAHGLLMITLWSYPVFGNSAVLSGVMRASGAVVWPTAISIISIWCVEVPVAYTLMRHIGLDGIWIGYPAAFCAGLAMQTAYYKAAWKQRAHERLV
jgi:putative MATE family efflux protein